MITDDDKSPGRTTSDDSFNDVLKNMKKQTQLLQEIESNTEDMSNVQLEIKNELLRTNLGENKSKVSSTSKSGTEVDESSSWLSKLAKFSLGAAITGAIGWLFSTENPEIKNVREKAQKEVSEFLQSSIKDVYKWIKDSVSNTFNSIFGDSKESEERRKTIISTLGDIFTGISKFILEGFTTAFEFIKKKFENGETMEGAAWTVAAIALISKVVPDIILDLAKNIIGALKNVAVLALRGALTPAGLAAIAVAAAGAVGWQIGSMIYNTATDIPNNPTKEEADRNIKPDFPTVAVRSGGPSPEEQKSDLNERIKKQKQEIDILQETLQRQLEANQREYDKIPESVDEETRNKLQLEILNRSGISSVSKAKLDAENKLKELQDKLKELNDAADDDGKNKPKVSASEQTARVVQQTDQSIGANRQKPTAQQTDTPQGGGGDEQPQKQKNPARALVGNPNIKLMGIPRGREAAIKGAAEVGGAITASTLTTIVVFLPIVYIHGASGELFKDQALTVTFSLISSLVVAIFLIPMLYHLFFKNKKQVSVQYNHFEGYGHFLKKTLPHRWSIVIVSFVLVGLSLLLVPFIGSEFMPKTESKEFTVDIKMAEGTTLQRTSDAVASI